MEMIYLTGFCLLTSPETDQESLHSPAIINLRPSHACFTTSDLTGSRGILGLNHHAWKLRLVTIPQGLSSQWGSLGCNPPPLFLSCLYISTSAHVSLGDVTPQCFGFCFVFETMFQRNTASLRSSTASFPTEAGNERSAFCWEEGSHSLNKKIHMYIFGNLILQGLKGYNT